jgi:hypothetical protein
MTRNAVRFGVMTGVAAGLVGLAGCGTAAQLPGAAARSPAATAARKPVNPAAWAKAQARALARRMLAAQSLPPGARAVAAAGVPAPVPVAAQTIGAPGSLIEVGRLYLASGTEQAIIGYLRGHTPAGVSNTSFGSDGADGRTTRFVSYFEKSTPDGVDSAMLVASMLPDPRGGTLLRVDAEVVWCLPRTAAEHVNPAGYRAVVIAVHPFPPRPAVRAKTFTARSVIAKLARMLNVMHTVGGTLYSCPVFSEGYRLVFEPRSPSAKKLVVTEVACGFLDVAVGTAAQPALSGGGSLANLISRLVPTRTRASGHSVMRAG